MIIGITIFGTLFDWFGSLMDKGNWLGGWAIILTTFGSFVGLWVGYKVGRSYLD